MAKEKLVEVTVDRDVAEAPASLRFEKVELKGDRVLAITYAKDKANAGDVFAAVQAEGYGIIDVSTREADLEDGFLSRTTERRGGKEWVSPGRSGGAADH